MSSTTDIEMAYSPDGSGALTSSNLLITTNGESLKITYLLDMKKELEILKEQNKLGLKKMEKVEKFKVITDFNNNNIAYPSHTCG